MKDGFWVPIATGYINDLPKDRPYTKLEAIYSMQCDYNDGNLVTISGYADLWRWSRKKVRSFLDMINVEILYLENTKKKQNQKGQISIQIRDRSGTDKGQKYFIDNKHLQTQKNRKGTDKGQIRDRSGNSTIKKNNKKNNKNKDIVYPIWLNMDLWREFKKYRTKIKAPLTLHAEKLALVKLETVRKQGFDAVDIINQTIECGWKSFFPVKNKQLKGDKNGTTKYNGIGKTLSSE